MRAPRRLVVTLVAVALGACGGAAAPDAGADLGHDADPTDLGVDEGAPDLGTDAGPTDLGVDAGPDLGMDAGPDLGVDAGPPDLGPPDLGADAGLPDLGADAGAPDAGSGATLVGISAGGALTVAWLSDGTAYQWGVDGASVRVDMPVPVPGLTDVQMVSVGDMHQCALHRSGQVSCWGNGGSGSFGTGTRPTTSTLVDSMVTDAVWVAAGGSGGGSTCAVRTDGTVTCFGFGSYGRLGTGSGSDSLVPAAVVGITDAVQVSVGELHACALHAGGTVSCWGDNGFGQLGDGTTTTHNAPVDVMGLSDAVAVDCGFDATCALRSTGAIACWGKQSQNLLGDGTTFGHTSTPVAVTGITDAVSVELGEFIGCAVRATGETDCWGWEERYQLIGDDNALWPSPGGPVPTVGPGGALRVSVATYHACLTAATGAFCWGAGALGEIGDGTTPMSVGHPTATLPF